MPPLVVFLILVVATAGWIIWHLQQANRHLRSMRDQIVGEEERAFAFLHGLGAQLQKNHASSSMHQFITEGIASVLESPGAALYLLDAARTEFAPVMISPECPLYLDVPESLLEAGEEVDGERLNYLRLQSISVEHPIYGGLLKRTETLDIPNLAQHPQLAPAKPSPLFESRILAAPLIYADKTIGLLLVGRSAEDPSFSENDHAVFESMTDQTAFALGSAMIHREAHEKRILESELRTASEFQRILLPARAPELATFDIAAANFPALIVSGDYFDYLPVDEGHLGVTIADVAGKGLPASLIMATCRSVLRSQAPGQSSPSQVLSVVNQQIFQDIREDMFITMIYLILDAKTDTIRLARAGHSAALIRRHDSGEIEAVDPVGMAVGIDSGSVFERILADREIEFRPRDLLILYTDGVTEALNETGEEYGGDRFRESIQSHSAKASEEIVAAICEDLRSFTGNAPQSDDITLIAIKKG